MFPLRIEETDELEELLGAFGGDALAALRSVLDDCHHLHAQLTIAQTAMSKGFTRGWVPNPDREASGNVG